jgi:lipooligosaccharide transport system permease protein
MSSPLRSSHISYNKISRWGFIYVVEYRVKNMLKWWTSILAFGLGNPLLYVASVGLGIGTLVDANLGDSGIEGVRYLVFIAPALLATAAIQSAMDETAFPTLHGFVWEKIFFAMNATALTGRQIATGILFSSMIRTTFIVSTYWIVLVGFGVLDFRNDWIVIPAALFAGIAWGSVILAMTSFVEQDDGFFAIVNRFLITPMFLFSGTFYPLDLLPNFLQWFGWLSPLWHSAEFGRFLTFNYAIETPLLIWHFCYLAILGLIGWYIAGRQFERRLAK